MSLAEVERLEEEQLSEGDIPDLDVINLDEVGLIASLLILLANLLLHLDLPIMILGTGEHDVVRMVHLQVVARLQGMDDSLVAFLVYQ